MNFWMFKMTLGFLLWFATFTPSEKVALTSAFLVLIGVIGEYVVEVKAVEERKPLAKRIKRLSMALLVLGLSGDVLGIVMGQSEMAAITRESGDAATSARTARQEAGAVKSIADEARADAKDALAKAQAAQGELAHAETDAAKAQAAASRALSTADKAESHLADAMKRTNALTVQLDRITTSRSLPASPQLLSSLKPFKGTEYMFTGVCGDTECINLLRDIEKVLGLAEWKRVKAPHRVPGLVLWGKREDDDGVGFDFGPGVTISIESTIPDIEKKALESLPEYIRAAVALNSALASNISPSENTDRLVNPSNGTSTIVGISVGRKPLP